MTVAKKAAAAPPTEAANADATPPTIVQALARVMAEVRAVGKESQAPNNIGGFKFRGVDAVVNAVAPALRAAGVVVMPEVLAVERVTSTSKSGTLMMNVYVTTRYTFYGPAGDHLATTVLGEASDAGDKATAKAQSVALRVALLQALMLPTDDPDPDESNYERGNQQAHATQSAQAPTAGQALQRDLMGLAPDMLAQIQQEWPYPEREPSALDDEEVTFVRSWVQSLLAAPTPTTTPAWVETPTPGGTGDQPPS